MFSFFRKKSPPPEVEAAAAPLESSVAPSPAPPAASRNWRQWFTGASAPALTTEAASEPFLPAPAPEAAPPMIEAPPEPPEPEERRGWLDRLKGGLRKTGSSITQVFTGTQIDDALYEDLEAALLLADAGMKATQHLLADLKRRVKESRATDPAAVRGLLADAITALLEPLEKPLVVGEYTPTVLMVAGVNGAGKTTTIGKLAKRLAEEGASVTIAAGDTFRAAAIEQLRVWADRAKARFVASKPGGDAAGLAYEALEAARVHGSDILLIDTAGRLQNKAGLMAELEKIARVIKKLDPSAPHAVLLVLDATTGQNAISQVEAFSASVPVTGLVMTKLDGTAKGGILVALAGRFGLPVHYIGIGEGEDDLQAFVAADFARALVGAESR
jgi:fused signal recognition particle receptor